MSLNLGNTLLNVHTAKLAGLPLTYLCLDNLNLRYKPFPSALLRTLETLKLWGAGLVADAGEFVVPQLQSLSIAGNDFSEVKLWLGGTSFSSFLVGDSRVQLDFSPANIAYASNFAAQDIDLSGQDAMPRGNFDCTNCSITKIDYYALSDKIYSVRNNNIYGDCPSTGEVQGIITGNTLVYDLNGNPLFCNKNGDDAFDCTYVRPVGLNGTKIVF